MSINYGYQPIVTNGLVLHLDAANPNSYRSGSTAWNDLSGNRNNGTLVSGSGYSPINGGTITFDGVNDYVSGSFINTSSLDNNAITLEAWVYHNVLTNSVQRYISTGNLVSEGAVIRFDGPVTNSTLRFYIVTSTGFKYLTVSGQLFINNWYHIVGTWDGTTQRLYNNGIQIASSNPSGTLVLGHVAYTLSSPAEAMNGYIPISKIYNRALSATEVQQNYLALKSRYGL